MVFKFIMPLLSVENHLEPTPVMPLNGRDRNHTWRAGETTSDICLGFRGAFVRGIFEKDTKVKVHSARANG